MEQQPLYKTWVRQVLQNYVKSRTANAAAGGSLLVLALPKINQFLNNNPGVSLDNLTLTQMLLIGVLITGYIVARGMADKGKEGMLMDMRKNVSMAMTDGVLNHEKTKAFQLFIETGDLDSLLKSLEAAALKDKEDLEKAESAKDPVA